MGEASARCSKTLEHFLNLAQTVGVVLGKMCNSGWAGRKESPQNLRLASRSVNLLQSLHLGFVVLLTALGFLTLEFVLENGELLFGDVEVESERALVLLDII